MRLQSLEAVDFLSLSHVLLSFPADSVVLVSGSNLDSHTAASNGAGKSALLETFCWAITGKTLRNVRKLDQVVRYGAQEAIVSLAFSGGIRVERRRRFEGTSTLRFWVEDDERTCHRLADTQKLLDEMFHDFREAVYLDYQLQSPFTRATDGERKQLLEQLLDLSVWQECEKVARTRARTSKLSLESATNLLASDKEALASRTTELLHSSDDSGILETLNEEIATKQEQVTALDQLAPQDTTDLDKQVDEINGQIHALEKHSSGLEARQASAKFELSSLEAQLSKLSTLDECPTCYQHVPTEHKERVASTVEPQAKSLREQVDALTGELKATGLQLESLRASRDELQGQSEEISRSNSVLQQSQLKAHQELGELTSRLNQYKARIADTFKDSVSKILEQTRIRSGEVAEQERTYRTKSWLQDFFHDLRSRMVEDYLSTFNSILQEYVGIISNGEEHVRYHVGEDGSIVQTVIARGQEVDVFSRSNGERKRLDLAVQLSLFKLANTVNGRSAPVLVLDEVLDSLDPVGMQLAMDLLAHISREGKMTYFTTHSEDVRSMLQDCNFIHLTKSNGQSTVDDFALEATQENQ